MTEDQLKHANEVWYDLQKHHKLAKHASFECDDYYSRETYPKEISQMHTQQLRDWHKLRAYELAEEFAKL